MNSITQDIVFKQSVVEYSLKHGVTAAAKRYKQHRKTIYRWREKYDGTRKSLVNKSRRPHSNPKQHTEEEIKKIKKYRAHNKADGLVVFSGVMDKIMEEWIYKKYNRSIQSNAKIRYI